MPGSIDKKHSPPADNPPESGEASRMQVHFRQESSPVNLTLIVCSVLLTVWTGFGASQARTLPWLISLFPANSHDRLYEILHGQVWRLLTPVFLHGSPAHLGFNLLGMITLGGVLERFMGSRAYLWGTLIVALGSNLGEYFVSGSGSFGGISGVVYGLFGYVWLRARTDRTFPLFLPTEAVVLSLVWFVLCFTGYMGPIANAAHTFGLILGGVWGVLDGRETMQQVHLEGSPGQISKDGTP